MGLGSGWGQPSSWHTPRVAEGTDSLDFFQVLVRVLVGHIGRTDVKLKVRSKVFEVVIIGKLWLGKRRRQSSNLVMQHPGKSHLWVPLGLLILSQTQEGLPDRQKLEMVSTAVVNRSLGGAGSMGHFSTLFTNCPTEPGEWKFY